MTARRTETRILAALAGGQMHKRMLCAALDTDYENIDPTMTRLLRDGRVVILGKAKEAGYTGRLANAMMYGLPGTKLVRVATPKKGRRVAGSGVVAGKITRGRGSNWNEEPE